ncbi:MAG: hypothetical protein H7Y27_08370 [Gemmatimonadaceae bacterium]|nr:hypothetical protein [Chitinophagaceae bacterium]
MIYPYVVTLRNNNRRLIDTISILMLIVSVLLFLRELALSADRKIIYFIVPLIIALIVGKNIYQQKKGKAVNYQTALLIAGTAWIAMPFLNWLAIPFLLMGLIEKQAKFPLEVGFSDDKVVINSLIRRRYSWTEFNNVMLRDDLLTLDFKNNRLFQRETVDEESDVEVDDFNEYCEERMKSESLKLKG